MALARTTTVTLLCSIAFATSPASARALNKAAEIFHSVGESSAHVELTDMSARRRHRAKRPHVKRYSAGRGHYRRAAVVRPVSAGVMIGMPDHHGVAGVAAYPAANTVAHSSARAEARSRGSARYSAVSDVGGTGIVAEARRYIGTNPTGRSSLWCGHFMNLVLERSGRRGSGSNMARSFASYGTRVAGPQIGAIAVMSRGRGGGHVGVVSGIDASGNPIVISGNHGRRVAETTYSRGRVYAYVMP